MVRATTYIVLLLLGFFLPCEHPDIGLEDLAAIVERFCEVPNWLDSALVVFVFDAIDIIIGPDLDSLGLKLFLIVVHLVDAAGEVGGLEILLLEEYTLVENIGQFPLVVTFE